jgi:D-ornithine 4,5-aminomutase subunit beta
MHPAEGSVFEIKGVLRFAVERDALRLPAAGTLLDEELIEAWVRARDIKVVAATVGEDEHSVGLREILDIKHGGIEKYGFRCFNLGTSVPVGKLLDAAEECDARVVLVSTIVTHNEIHRANMRKLHALAVERGIRDRLLLIAGGTQVTDAAARDCGMDAGFGRGATGWQVASFIVSRLQARSSA